jgi:hypothetical protein
MTSLDDQAVSVEVTEKHCVSCDVLLPLDEFGLKQTSTDGHKSTCKACDKTLKEGGEIESARKPYVYKGVRGGPLIAGYIR